MMKKVSAIHAIKCNASNDYKEAEKSFDKLSELKMQISEDDEGVEEAIENWAAEAPVASAGEVNRILHK